MIWFAPGVVFPVGRAGQRDPDVQVSRWRLSDRRVARMRAFVASPMVDGVREVWASTETKAIEAAGLLAARFGLAVNVHPELGGNDSTRRQPTLRSSLTARSARC